MRNTAARCLHTSFRASNNASASCAPSYGVASPKASKLPPIRYHIFREPLPYPVGLDLQREIIDRRLEKRDKGKGKASQDVLLLLQHVPTYTTGRRDNTPNPDTLHPEEKKVQSVGADFFITKRGGQVTYHGPGQLVGYPIFDLNAMDLSTRCYVDYMQRLLSKYCKDLGIPNINAPHPDGHVGVFAGSSEKVASIGIHLRHRITSHGFAINILPTPIKWFDLVIACGLSDMKATSVHQLLEKEAISSGIIPGPLPTVEDAANSMVHLFKEAYGREILQLEGKGTEKINDEVQEEIEGLKEVIAGAEREARRINEEKGGWRDEPDLKKDIP